MTRDGKNDMPIPARFHRAQRTARNLIGIRVEDMTDTELSTLCPFVPREKRRAIALQAQAKADGWLHIAKGGSVREAIAINKLKGE